MASNVWAPKFNPVPPDKGSFPLDREGECKKFYAKYMLCLIDNERNAGKCRQESKDYLDCRMEKGLMDRDTPERLGFADLHGKNKDGK